MIDYTNRDLSGIGFDGDYVGCDFSGSTFARPRRRATGRIVAGIATALALLALLIRKRATR